MTKLFVVAILLLISYNSGALQAVSDSDYSTCPQVESIVKGTVLNFKANNTIAATLRLFFHDCFVEGCDASILIDSKDETAERYGPPNLSLKKEGFDIIIKAKQALEVKCPKQVSCADILAIAARDVVVMAGGPYYAVELGRRDGLISNISRIQGNIPHPFQNFSELMDIFTKKNMTIRDLVALSGGHTIGTSHCRPIAPRLYSFNSTLPLDPSLNITYAKQLMLLCPKTVDDPKTLIKLDPLSPCTLDNSYYKNLLHGKGLFVSDQSLLMDPSSKKIVEEFADNPDAFSKAFAESMVKLGRLDIKKGYQGEIREDCTKFNP